MQKEKLLEVRNRVNEEIDGLKFIKTMSVGIPYARMKLNITTRKEYQIPLTHETILKLIEEKWTNYDQLREILGVDQDYFDNVLLELGSSDFITHFGKQIGLTDQGRRVLSDLRSIKIEPDLMENVHVNLLNGLIVNDGSNNYSRYREKINCDVYLNKVEDLSGNFLVNHEADIRDLYTERVSGETRRALTDDNILRDELYRVINIEEHDIVYEEVVAHLYYSMESDSLTYIFNSGNSMDDEMYYSCLKNQYRDHPKSFDRLYDTRYYFQNKYMFSKNKDEITSLDSLSHKRDELRTFLISPNIRFDQILDCYYDNRLLFYREYQDILSNLAVKTPNELTIITDHFYDLQKSEYSALYLLEAISKKSKIYIGYLQSNRDSQKFINNLKARNIEDLTVKEITNIIGTTIIIDNEYMINVSYKPLFVGKEVIFEEISVMTTDHEKIAEEREKYKDLYT